MGLDGDGEVLHDIITVNNNHHYVADLLVFLNWDFARLEACVNQHKRWAFVLECHGQPPNIRQYLYVDHLNTYDPNYKDRKRKRPRVENEDEGGPVTKYPEHT